MSVELVGPDGKQYTLESDDPALLANAKAKGFRVAADIGAVEGALDTAKAAAVGVAEGLSGNLLSGGLAASQGDEEPPESAQARWSNSAEQQRLKEESPIASTLGEVAGLVASPLNAPGAAVTKGIGAATKLGRLAASAAGGATSGLLFGAGKTVSDAALGDTALTAEKLVAGAGLGALLGGAGGGIGGAIEEGARAVLPSVRTLASRAKGALDDIANDATIGATKAAQSAVNRLGDVRAKAAAEAMRREGVLGEKLLSSPDDILKSLEQKIGRTGAEKSAILDVAETGGARPVFSELTKRLDDFEAGLNPLQKKVIANDLKELRDAVHEYGARPVTATGKKGSGFRALDDLRQSVAKRGKFSKGAAGVDDETLALKRELAGTFRDEIDKQLVPQLGPDIGKHWADTKELYGALKDAAALAKSGSGRAGGVSVKDLGWGIMTAAATGHPLGIAGAIGAKALREYGPAIAARIADKLTKEPALSAMAKSFAASLPTTAPKLGPYGAVLAQEAAVSPERALAMHMAYAQLDPSYAATAQLAGLTPELPDEHDAALSRAQALAEAQAAAQAHDKALDDAFEHIGSGKQLPGAAAVLKSQDFGSKKMRQDSNESFRRRVEEVRLLSTDPAALVERVSANLRELGDVAPSVAVAMQGTAQRAVQYLAQAAEVPPKPGPLAREWTPTLAEQHAFALKLEAVQNPMSVLRRASRGTLVKSQLDAVRAVYPAFAAELQSRALERLASGVPMPRRSRLMLSLMTGLDADGTMSPRAVAGNQSAIANAGRKPSEQMGAAPSDPAAAKLGDAGRMATPGQRRGVTNLEDANG